MTTRKKPAPRTRAERMGLPVRDRGIFVRVRPEEEAALEQAAAAVGLPLATWLRRVALAWIERGKVLDS